MYTLWDILLVAIIGIGAGWLVEHIRLESARKKAQRQMVRQAKGLITVLAFPEAVVALMGPKWANLTQPGEPLEHLSGQLASIRLITDVNAIPQRWVIH